MNLFVAFVGEKPKATETIHGRLKTMGSAVTNATRKSSKLGSKAFIATSNDSILTIVAF